MKRDGMLVLVHRDPPKFPSRWCRLLGHSNWMTQERRGTRVLNRRRECERCGAYELWEHIDRLSDEERAEAEALT